MSNVENTCRLCDRWDGSKVRYGIRHYAHAGCGLNKWGAKFLDKLSLHELQNFPALVAREHNQLKYLQERIESVKAELKCRRDRRVGNDRA